MMTDVVNRMVAQKWLQIRETLGWLDAVVNFQAVVGRDYMQKWVRSACD